jgi:hypothetical protein
MKTKRKILLVFSVIFLVSLLAAGGILTYFILHPTKIKGMVEESLSRAMGADLTIGTLSFSMDPLVLSSSDIQVRPKGAAPGLLLHVPSLSTRMALQGPLGRRTLIIRQLSLPEFTLAISGEADLPRTGSDSRPISLFARVAIRLLSILLFKDIRLERGSIGDGSIQVDLREGTIQLTRVHAEFESSRPPEVTCSATVRLANGELVADLPRFRITGPETLSLYQPVTGDVLFEDGSLRLPGVKASRLSGRGLLKAEALKKISFEPFDLTASPVNISYGGREIRLEKARLLLHNGFIDMERSTVSIPEITVSSSLLKDFRAALESNADESRITLTAEKVGIWEPLQNLNLLPPAWRFSGEDGFQGNAVFDNKGWSFSGNLNLQRMIFQDPTGEYIGEGLFLGVEFAGNSSAMRTLRFEYSAKVDKGEILLDRTYIDLNKNAFHVSGNAEVEERRAQSTFNMSLEDILSLSGEAGIEFKEQDSSLVLSGHFPESPVEPVFQHLVSETFKKEFPLLGAMSVSGVFSADVELSLGSEWSMKGRSRLLQGTISSKDPPFRLQGVRFDLPFFLGDAKLGAVNQTGTLQIDSMELPYLPIQPLNVETRSGPNSLFLRGPISLLAPGGRVEIGSVSVAELATSPVIHTSLSVDQLDLDPVLSKIWRRSVGGKLSGRLDPVRYAGGAISTKGPLKADVFGGEVMIENLGVKGIFSFPAFSLDGRWEDISLLDLSIDTSFGRIQGILRGRVKELEIAQLQPQRFDLFLETVKKEGVPQKISIDAVDNIARIGGGQSPFRGAAGLLSTFFREFAYSKIGVKAILENDIFRINGTIKEGDVEYIVKRGSFSGVNVVNQNPDNRISFKDMLKRIQRIGSPGSAPVIR